MTFFLNWTLYGILLFGKEHYFLLVSDKTLNCHHPAYEPFCTCNLIFMYMKHCLIMIRYDILYPQKKNTVIPVNYLKINIPDMCYLFT